MEENRDIEERIEDLECDVGDMSGVLARLGALSTEDTDIAAILARLAHLEARVRMLEDRGGVAGVGHHRQLEPVSMSGGGLAEDTDVPEEDGGGSLLGLSEVDEEINVDDLV